MAVTDPKQWALLGVSGLSFILVMASMGTTSWVSATVSLGPFGSETISIGLWQACGSAGGSSSCSSTTSSSSCPNNNSSCSAYQLAQAFCVFAFLAHFVATLAISIFYFGEKIPAQLPPQTKNPMVSIGAHGATCACALICWAAFAGADLNEAPFTYGGGFALMIIVWMFTAAIAGGMYYLEVMQKAGGAGAGGAAQQPAPTATPAAQPTGSTAPPAKA